MAKLKGPRFIQYFQPVIDGLRELGSSAKPKEVYSWIAEHHDIPEAEIEGTTKGGQSKFENKVGWARFYLAKAGLIDTEQRGVWILTEKGREANLTHEDAYTMFREIHESFDRAERSIQVDDTRRPVDNEDASAPDENAYLNQDETHERLVAILKGLSPKGFEELCARLLRHVGFENVKVTGERGDKGIDGEGYLLINRFVRTKVMFQCKRYDGSIGPEKIREFRGAIQGKAERGIFLTTGTFTKGAKEAAAQENATAIELVDIDRLLDLLIEEGLGVRETKALTIEADFFVPYQERS